MAQQEQWLERVDKHMKRQKAGSGTILLFPGYRPDLCMALSNHLGLDFYDFRKEEMLEKGWGAGSIPLESVTESLLARSRQSGIVAHNVEAVLATRPEAERAGWFESFLTRTWPNTVIVPSAVFQPDVPREYGNVCDLEWMEMPEQSYLIRLAT